MKFAIFVMGVVIRAGPAPHGAGGLKSSYVVLCESRQASRPAWGGWIEILVTAKAPGGRSVPPRMGRVD